MKNRLNNIILTQNSSFVRNVSYDPKLNKGTLQVALTFGTYRYYRVSPSVFSEFITHASTGQAYNNLIKDKFRRRRMKNKAAAALTWI